PSVPTISAPSTATPTDSAVSSVPASFAMPRPRSWAAPHSMYDNPPLVSATASATSAVSGLPSPTLPFQSLEGSAVQAPSEAALRYVVMFSVVPDAFDRKNTEIVRSGSGAPSLSAAIAGSFHLVILPLK